MVIAPASAATTILDRSASLAGYSSGYAYEDPFSSSFPRAIITVPSNSATNAGATISLLGTYNQSISSNADYVGRGQSSIASFIGVNEIDVSLQSVSGVGGGFAPGASVDGQAWNSSASGSFTVTFAVDVPTRATITGNTFGGSALPGTASLSFAGGAIIYAAPGSAFGATLNFDGMLAPGNYSFSAGVNSPPVHPQAGYQPTSRVTSSLLLTPVPEPGASCLLLLALAPVLRRGRRM